MTALNHPIKLSTEQRYFEAKKIAWVDNARIVAAFTVVLVHTAAGVVLEKPLGEFNWWIGNIMDSAGRWSGPMFVLISGFLLLDPAREESPIIFYKKRAGKILIPWLFWSIFYSVWTAIRDLIRVQPVSMRQLGERWLTGDPYYHMWFLYMLVGLYLITPYLRRLLRSLNEREIVRLCVILLFLAAIFSLVNFLCFRRISWLSHLFLFYIGYYIAGYLLGRYEHRLSSPTLIFIFILSVVISCSGFYWLFNYRGMEMGLYFYDLLSIPLITMSLAAFSLFKDFNKPFLNDGLTRNLAFLSLGIYLIHPAVLEMVGFFGLRPASFPPLLSIPLIAALVFFLSALSVLILSKIPYLKSII